MPTTNDPRAQLLALIERYSPIDTADAQMAERLRAFVESTLDCFERTHEAGHVTGSSWIVDPTDESTLFTHHKKLDRWLQLGGHCDGDSDVLRVAIKEAEEESGILDFQVVTPDIFDIDIHPIPARGDIPSHFHYDVRFALRAPQREFAISDESNDLRWIAIRELHAITSEQSLLRMREKWLSLQ